MRARRDAAIRLLKTVLVVSIALPVALFGYASWTTYQSTHEHTDQQIAATLDILSEHTAKIFQSVDLTFAGLTALTGELTDEAIAAAEPALHPKLKALADSLPAIDTIWVIDRNGHPLVSSSVSPIPADFNVADRDYFQAQVAQDAGTYIGTVLKPKLTNKPFIGVSRRRPSADGTFNGTVVVSVPPTIFVEFYKRLAGQTAGGFTLVRNDGTILARHPAPPQRVERFGPQSGFMRTIAVQPEGGFVTAPSIDGGDRRIGLRRLEVPTLYSTAGLPVAVIRAEWMSTMASHLVFGVPATVILIFLVLLTMRRTQDFYAEVERRALAEQALRQAQKMEAVGQLTGGVAHDFNNLLTIIIGNIGIAKRGVVEARAERALNNALTGAERAAQLTQRLLAFSRRQPLNPRALDTNKMIAGMTDLLNRSLGEKVELEAIGGAGLWPIEADASELESCMLNLALNARDAMPEGGKLTIETSNAYLDDEYCRRHDGVTPGQYVLIAFSDNGTGMPPEAVEKAFEPFFTTKEPGKGTGLGLSQVYGFVKQSGGHVKIYSELGHGTSIKLYFPRHDGSGVAEVADDEGVADGGRGETILVVEDDEGVRQYTAEILRDLNYKVIEAKDAATALRLLDADKEFDLLLTDVVLPGKNGRELADEVERRRPHTKVIFMTGYSRNAIVHHGRLDRGTELISKPLTERVLARKIRQVLDASAK